MEPPVVWCDAFGVAADLVERRIAALSQTGLALNPTGTPPATGSGLLFFDRVTENLCDRLRDHCCEGCDRILTVGVGSAPLSPGESWRLLASGASDVLRWNDSADCPEEIRARLERWREVDRLVGSPLVRNRLAGRSRAWTAVLRQVVEVARFATSPTMVTGATGTGKELVARLIHTLDDRLEKKDLVVLDCTTIAPELAGSEFFGHKKGAFTNAATSREGAFALADGGTLFLDEVGELRPRLQAELLRITQERTYKRVGGNSWRRTDFRLICATNRNLLRAIEQGAFRSDFYYRVASCRIHLPPLEERREDILPLVRHFLGEVYPDQDLPELSPAVRDYFLARDYPGNVRDLRQLVLQIGQRHVGPGPITAGDIPESERPPAADFDPSWRSERFTDAIRQALASGVGMKEIGNAAADTAVQIALESEGGNVKRAAQKLGITDRALQLRRAARRNQQAG
jgi:transcriptional regulator with GAF, ATPase, and Fis domain